jgi:hypothetical protein
VARLLLVTGQQRCIMGARLGMFTVAMATLQVAREAMDKDLGSECKCLAFDVWFMLDLPCFSDLVLNSKDLSGGCESAPGSQGFSVGFWDGLPPRKSQQGWAQTVCASVL